MNIDVYYEKQKMQDSLENDRWQTDRRKTPCYK